MSDDYAHLLITNELNVFDGEGWEFHCPRCGYRLRFIENNKRGNRELHVLDRGDPTARHISIKIESLLRKWLMEGNELRQRLQEQLSADALWQLMLASERLEAADAPVHFGGFYNDDHWLTPEIRDTIGEIVAGPDESWLASEGFSV